MSRKTPPIWKSAPSVYYREKPARKIAMITLLSPGLEETKVCSNPRGIQVFVLISQALQ